MAIDNALYIVSGGIATRSGLIKSRYRTADGRFILDNKDLSRVRFTTDEYINGLDGVEKIPLKRAKELIKKNGYKMGPAPSAETDASYDYTPDAAGTETAPAATAGTTGNDDIDSLNEALRNDDTGTETTETETEPTAETESDTEPEAETEQTAETGETDKTEDTTNG